MENVIPLQAPPATERRMLFLQGPHGPFLARLARMLRRAGVPSWRVAFNLGDDLFWTDRKRLIRYRGRAQDWPQAFAEIVARHAITDLALYGDTRPIHAKAIAVAKAMGLRVHVFEEGYLRPYWVTYERDGANGHSPLMALDLDTIRAALDGRQTEMPAAPAHWGDMRQHVFWGALYHFLVLIGGGTRAGTHRGIGVAAEMRLYLRKLLLMPLHRLSRLLATHRIRRGGYPYHLVLLQLEHDANFRAHSPFASQVEFVREVIAGFAQGAPRHHHLVFKTHPLEDGRAPLRAAIRAASGAHGLRGRVHIVRGGKLAALLDLAASVITVNSTAAQQALWRGLPLKAFGTAVYSRAEFVSDQALADFFAAPRRPDLAAYRAYRQFLLATSQIPGGFYARASRQRLLRHIVDLMLAGADPYAEMLRLDAADRQQIVPKQPPNDGKARIFSLTPLTFEKK